MHIIEQAHAPRSKWRGFGRWFLVGVLLAIIVFGLIYIRVQTAYGDKIVEIPEIPATHQTAIVYGAGLKAKGIPGDILEDRVLTALEVYQAGIVEQVVMSGTVVENHDEVQAMVNLAVQEGLSENVIIKDYTGDSTFETCANIALQYPENGVVLITQGFHLKRALYICNKMGLKAIGVDAARRPYIKHVQYTLREIPASILDWFEVLMYNIRTR